MRNCRICNRPGEYYKFYRSIKGYCCVKCNNEKTRTNLDANTFLIRKLIERIEVLESRLKDQEYELVLDVKSLSEQLKMPPELCKECIIEGDTEILFTRR